MPAIQALRVCLFIFLAAVVASCTGYTAFIDGLNKRQVQSCIKGQMAGWSIPVAGSLEFTISTGGVQLETCLGEKPVTRQELFELLKGLRDQR